MPGPTMPRRLLPAALACGAVLFGAAAPARAQHPCPGHISATALRPLPADASFGIALASDEEVQRALRQAALGALRAAGRRVAEREDAATHLLSWRGGLGTNGEAPSVPSLYGPIDSFHDSDDLHWMQDVPRGRAAGRARSAARLRLTGVVELHERASGRVAWVAVLSCDRRATGDRDALIGALVGAVVPLIGQSASGRPF